MSTQLQKILTEHSLTQTALARAVGVNKSTVSRWCAHGMSAEWAIKIERALGISRVKLRPDLFDTFEAFEPRADAIVEDVARQVQS